MILPNPRHEVFAQTVAKGASQAEAARVAGYSEKSAKVAGSKLVSNPAVKVRIEELRNRGAAVAVADVAISKEWVLQKLVTIAEQCTGKERYAPGAANKALELIGKEIGMFHDTLPMETFHAITRAMALVVMRYCTDQNVLDRIVGDWERLTFDPTRKFKEIEEVEVVKKEE